MTEKEMKKRFREERLEFRLRQKREIEEMKVRGEVEQFKRYIESPEHWKKYDRAAQERRINRLYKRERIRTWILVPTIVVQIIVFILILARVLR